MGYRDLAYRFYWKIEKTIVPGLRDSQYRYKEVLTSAILPGLHWLDLGCGHQIFPAYMSSSEKEEHRLVETSGSAVGLDCSYASLRDHRSIRTRIIADLQQLPFQEASFNVISANMVMEHVKHPEEALSEIKRILKPGGIFIFHTPNALNYAFRVASIVPQAIKTKLVWLLEGRVEEDVFPTFYRFNSKAHVENLVKETGLEIVRLELLNSTAVTAQLGPAAIPELAFIRLLEREPRAPYRSNMIGILKKIV
jgi:ubiquinone/menaquinone biosynthesis C-methylase UbiE